ncbi:hypothetical protein [Puniceibacterium sp. IMCC21224]|uniref:hypothetical protein n=1 Tax=Puniceibacterium sp. IMCC21224 TaxID=1618204 RepID=UPI00064DA32A|nr:hypothetical protein [Puniceibacterium sp. IMCC21224]
MSDPRDQYIRDLQVQMRLLGQQADAMRTELEAREEDIVRLSALLIAAQDAARTATRPTILAWLIRLARRDT